MNEDEFVIGFTVFQPLPETYTLYWTGNSPFELKIRRIIFCLKTVERLKPNDPARPAAPYSGQDDKALTSFSHPT